MIPTLFRFLSGGSPASAWGALTAALVLWWLLLWALFKVAGVTRARPVRVAAQARMALFLAGAIFLFNVAIVPVVLVAFHGVAGGCLLACAVATVVYLIQVDDREDKASAKGAVPMPRVVGRPSRELF